MSYGDNDGKKGFQPGNNLWKLADPETLGKPRIFSSPVELWSLCYQYFEFIEDSKMIETKSFSTISGIVDHETYKVRAMTKESLYTFLGIGRTTWNDYKKRPEFEHVVETVENIIYEQKFVNAAAGLLNANLISRELGLADKKDISSSDGSMTPKNFNDFYDDDGGKDDDIPKKIDLDEF